MIPPFAWVGELVPFFLRWGHKSQHVCHNVHKKLLVRSLFYTCIYFELTKHLGCGFKEFIVPMYRPQENKIQLLMPIYLDLEFSPKPDFALVLTPDEEHGVYVPHTILELDQVYKNARLIMKPNSTWLNPEKIF